MRILYFSISLHIQGPDTVCPASTEQEQAFLVQMAFVLLRHHCGQAVNFKAEVRVATGNVIIADFGQVNHSD